MFFFEKVLVPSYLYVLQNHQRVCILYQIRVEVQLILIYSCGNRLLCFCKLNVCVKG